MTSSSSPTSSQQPMIPPPLIKIDSIGGQCPVQAEGTINNIPFYFRARGNRWTLNLGGEDLIKNPTWFYQGNLEDAGWMSQSHAKELIEETAKKHCAIRIAQKMTEPSNSWNIPGIQKPDYSDLYPQTPPNP